MPPSQSTPPLIPNPIERPLLSAHQNKSSFGPLIGIVIILVLIGFGALYFWGASLNRQNTPQEIPYIPGDNSTPQAG